MTGHSTPHCVSRFLRGLRHRIKCGHWPADPDSVCWWCEMEWQRRHR